ncbi:hypothetical protein ABN09_10820 [Morganella morganii]|nr:hypothetical protein X965_12225 [Morganella sp. EGD-HP17]KLO02286.1 hypothetical protein ABN09_10820 [Morganella morganii]
MSAENNGLTANIVSVVYLTTFICYTRLLLNSTGYCLRSYSAIFSVIFYGLITCCYIAAVFPLFLPVKSPGQQFQTMINFGYNEKL